MKVFGVLVGVVMVGVLALVGYLIWFEANDPGHGQITKKHYSPAYYYTSCSTVGKVTTCVPQYMPECYEIDYTDGKHDGDACVAPEEYERYEVGGYYPAGAQ